MHHAGIRDIFLSLKIMIVLLVCQRGGNREDRAMPSTASMVHRMEVPSLGVYTL